MFVVEIRPETRQVVVGPREELWAGSVELQELNWLADPPQVGQEILVQLRHRAPAAPARLLESTDRKVRLLLHEPRFAVTPGQSGVLFSGERVLGGGRIVRGRAPGVSI